MKTAKNYKKTCLFCDRSFESNRRTARYCCDRHGSLYRQSRREQNMISVTQDRKVVFESNSIDKLRLQLDLWDKWIMSFQEKVVLEVRERFERHNTALTTAFDSADWRGGFRRRCMVDASTLNLQFGYNGEFPIANGLLFVGEFVLECAPIEGFYWITPLYYFIMNEATLKSIRFVPRQNLVHSIQIPDKPV
ncbi:hypothetical protein [Flaviaesturariibacter amylovorans]|uniref:hypothetical protein n=1 Tax=Flaviaesturariibacter amylovorans TaxID=1084520 RepID=UPI0031E7AE86